MFLIVQWRVGLTTTSVSSMSVSGVCGSASLSSGGQLSVLGGCQLSVSGLLWSAARTADSESAAPPHALISRPRANTPPRHCACAQVLTTTTRWRVGGRGGGVISTFSAHARCPVGEVGVGLFL